MNYLYFVEMNELDKLDIQSICGDIMSESDFWYQKSIDAWEQWKNMHIANEELRDLLSMKYDDFCNSDNQRITEIREKLFTTVAYFDAKSKKQGAL